jgi:hypothetical protein
MNKEKILKCACSSEMMRFAYDDEKTVNYDNFKHINWENVFKITIVFETPKVVYSEKASEYVTRDGIAYKIC